MKLKKSLIVFAAAIVSGVALANSHQTFAKKYVTVPASLRGHWYSDFGQLNNDKYHFRSKSNGSKWLTLSGKRFPKYARGHAEMFVVKNSKGYYNIGQYATDQWPFYKRVKHNGRAAIREIVYSGPDIYLDYYYKTKKAPAKKSTPKLSNLDLDYPEAPKTINGLVGNTVYTSELTDKDSPVDLFKTAADIDVDKPSAQIKSLGTPVTLIGMKTTSDDLFKQFDIAYNGQRYLVESTNDAKNFDLVPYNTAVVTKDAVDSSVKPQNKSDVKLKNGQTVNTKMTWYYTNSKSETYAYNYSLKSHKWILFRY